MSERIERMAISLSDKLKKVGALRRKRIEARAARLIAKELSLREDWLVPPTLVASAAPPRQPVMTFDELIRDTNGDREDR